VHFDVAYSGVWRCVMTAVGMGPRRSGVDVDGGWVVVRMGWAFQARVPRSAIVSAAREPGRRISIGVHGWRGDWLVNGSSRSIVALDIDPPVAARAVGVGIRLHRLAVSLEEPDAFLGALGFGARSQG
jgi:hypothetical protein